MLSVSKVRTAPCTVGISVTLYQDAPRKSEDVEYEGVLDCPVCGRECSIAQFTSHVHRCFAKVAPMSLHSQWVMRRRQSSSGVSRVTSR